MACLLALLSVSLVWAANGHRYGAGIFVDRSIPVLGFADWYPATQKYGITLDYRLSDRTTLEFEYHHAHTSDGKIEGKAFYWPIDKKRYYSPQANATFNLNSFLVNAIVRLNEATGSQPELVPYLAVGAGVYDYQNKTSGFIYPGQKVEPLDPDLVIVGFCINDIDDPRRHVNAHTLEVLGQLPEALIPNPAAEAGQGGAAVAQTPEEEVKGRLPIPFKGFLRVHSAFYRFLVRRYDALLKTLGIRDPVYYGELRRQQEEMDAKLSSYDTPEWQWLARQFDGFQALSEQTGVPWMLVLLPEQYELQREGESLPEERLGDYAREHGIPYVDPRPILAEEKNPSRLYIDMAHFSEEGHQLVAHSLFQALRGSDLLAAP